VTLEETAVLLAAVVMLYPGRVTPEPEAVALWTEMLADIDAAEAQRALRAHAATSPHPPCIADIRNGVAKMREPGIDVAAALEEIRRAVRYVGSHRPPPEWSSPRIAAAVNAIGWQAICLTDEGDLRTLHAQIRQLLEGSTATAQREANVGALESHRANGALSAGELAKKLLEAKS
jgi:hypothetical protein